MKTIFKLTESDVARIIKKVVKEVDPGDGAPDDFSEYEGRTNIYANSVNNPKHLFNKKSKKPLVYNTRNQNI